LKRAPWWKRARRRAVRKNARRAWVASALEESLEEFC
jgi:hypothetical protein